MASAGSGRLKRYPCTASQPFAIRKANWSSVSTPSATTLNLRLWAIAMIAVEIAASSASLVMWRTNDWSILSV